MRQADVTALFVPRVGVRVLYWTDANAGRHGAVADYHAEPATLIRPSERPAGAWSLNVDRLGLPPLGKRGVLLSAGPGHHVFTAME